MRRPLQYDLQCPAAKDNTITHAAAAPSHLYAAIALRYRDIELLNALELRTHEQRHVAEHQGRTDSTLKRGSRTRRTHEVPFIAACKHFTWKTQGFVLRLPPQHNPHATVMEPLQCVLQHHTHIHWAITMRFASPHCRAPSENQLRVETIQTATAAHRRCPSSPPTATLHRKTQGFVLRLPPQHESHATFMQPLHCDLQRQISFILLCLLLCDVNKVSHRPSQTNLVMSCKVNWIKNHPQLGRLLPNFLWEYIYLYIHTHNCIYRYNQKMTTDCA